LSSDSGGRYGEWQLRPVRRPWLLELGESYWRWEKGSIESRGRRLASGARSPAAQSSWGRAMEGGRRCSVLRLEEEVGRGLLLVCTATSCGWFEVSWCSTRLNLQAVKGGSWREKSRPANCARRRWHSDVAEFQGWQDDSTCSGARLRRGLQRAAWLVGRARGHYRAAALSLSVRGVLSSSAATCPSPAARRLLGARSTCTTRCVDGASKAEKAVADNLQAPTRMLLAGMEVRSRRRGVSKGE